jgi:hypothetical protein
MYIANPSVVRIPIDTTLVDMANSRAEVAANNAIRFAAHAAHDAVAVDNAANAAHDAVAVDNATKNQDVRDAVFTARAALYRIKKYRNAIYDNMREINNSISILNKMQLNLNNTFNNVSKGMLKFNQMKSSGTSYDSTQVLVSSTDSISASASTTCTSLPPCYPWSGGEIKGYFYWESNFIGSSPATQSFATGVSSQQYGWNSSSNINTGAGTFNYSPLPPNSNTSYNSIFLFTGYSNIYTALTNVTQNMFNNAYNYLNDKQHLLGLVLGGGSSLGNWNLGSTGAIYSVYQAVTKANLPFSYSDSFGYSYSGTGTGALTNNYNCLVFDIECYNYVSSPTTNYAQASDFSNLFAYIKTGTNSTFNNQTGYQMVIIVTMSHTISTYAGNGSVLLPLYSDNTYDYISPQLYTQNAGTTNEYCGNYLEFWSGVVSSMNNNTNFTNKYGLNMILPSINLSCLYNSSGSNLSSLGGGYSNLYFYQSGDNGNANSASSFSVSSDFSASGTETINYPTDSGVINFVNAVFNESGQTLGGYVQWVNGTLTVNGNTYY